MQIRDKLLRCTLPFPSRILLRTHTAPSCCRPSTMQQLAEGSPVPLSGLQCVAGRRCYRCPSRATAAALEPPRPVSYVLAV